MKRNKARTYALYSQRRENKKALSPPNSIITQKKPLVNSFIEKFFLFTQFSREFLRQVKNFFSLQFGIFFRLLFDKSLATPANASNNNKKGIKTARFNPHQGLKRAKYSCIHQSTSEKNSSKDVPKKWTSVIT